MTEALPRLETSLGLWQDRPANEVIDTCLIADSLGYRNVWIGEMATWDAFALGAHVAPQLHQAGLVLGPFAVTVRDPAMIAMGIASVAALTERPVSVALGTSSAVVVEQWHGRSRARAGRALTESAQAVRVLLDGGKSDGVGEVVGSKGYRLRLPATNSEVIVAAFGPGAIRTAALHSDRMVLNLIDPPTAADLVAQLRAIAEEVGRPCPRVAIWTSAAIGDDKVVAAGLEQLRFGLVGYLAAPGYSDMFAKAGFGELVEFARSRPHPRELLAAIPDEAVTSIGVIGDADQARKRMAEFHAAGVDDVVLVACSTDADPAGAGTLRAAAEIVGQV